MDELNKDLISFLRVAEQRHSDLERLPLLEDLVNYVHKSNRALIERIRSELPKKLPVKSNDQDHDGKLYDFAYINGKNAMLDDIIDTMTALEREMK